MFRTTVDRLFAFKPLRFLISGGLAAVVDLGALFVLVHFFGLWYLFSAVIAFILAFGVSFTMHKFFTFEEHSVSRTPRQLLLYFVTALVNLAVNSGLMFVGVDLIGLHYVVAQIIVLGIVSFCSFFVYQRIIFRKRVDAGTIEGV